MRIIPFEERYRDDMIFMVLEAKNALGRVPTLNEDLLDIRANYLDRGEMFWLALADSGRVIGCGGYNEWGKGGAVKLHRLYVKHDLKRRGIGTALLETVEEYIKEKGYSAIHVHLGGPEYFESRGFYTKHGYVEYAPDHMKKDLLK